jgi:hypothetical protein
VGCADAKSDGHAIACVDGGLRGEIAPGSHHAYLAI